MLPGGGLTIVFPRRTEGYPRPPRARATRPDNPRFPGFPEGAGVASPGIGLPLRPPLQHRRRRSPSTSPLRLTAFSRPRDRPPHRLPLLLLPGLAHLRHRGPVPAASGFLPARATDVLAAAAVGASAGAPPNGTFRPLPGLRPSDGRASTGKRLATFHHLRPRRRLAGSPLHVLPHSTPHAMAWQRARNAAGASVPDTLDALHRTVDYLTAPTVPHSWCLPCVRLISVPGWSSRPLPRSSSSTRPPC